MWTSPSGCRPQLRQAAGERPGCCGLADRSPLAARRLHGIGDVGTSVGGDGQSATGRRPGPLSAVAALADTAAQANRSRSPGVFQGNAFRVDETMRVAQRAAEGDGDPKWARTTTGTWSSCVMRTSRSTRSTATTSGSTGAPTSALRTNCSFPVHCVKCPTARQVRAAARARHGWIMDTYLLRLVDR